MFVLGLGAIAILSLVYVGVSAVLEWLRERRAIRALDEPRHPLEGVDERSLGLAVTTFVYGVPRQDVPGSHEDALQSRFGRRREPCGLGGLASPGMTGRAPRPVRA